MTSLTRGPLPARVYWTRRILALAVLLGLVVGVVQLAQLAGGEPAEPDRAAPVAAEASTTTAPVTTPSETDPGDTGTRQRKDNGKRKDQGPVLATPEGPCTDSDIAVTPVAKDTVAGSPVTFVLELRTISSPACTWQVSPQTVTVKVSSGKDDIWSSRECPRAVPNQRVVVRDNVSTEVSVTWSARRSDEECSRLTDWALPGWYHVNAAALAGEPSDLQFELSAPKPRVVTETVRPDPKQGGKKKGDKKNRDGEKDRAKNGDAKNRDGDRG
jgi:hypothetical protein